jgi:hypothetical protein
MASKGRNGDSMLVHMTPGEVHGLQALAMKHGGSLTVNPDTGLPEANFLKSLLPMLAGFALNAFVPGLGAAVGGAFGASAAVGTGIAVGGLAGLATGSLSKGLMAGLGAYGGAGLGESLMGAGAASGAGQAIATEAATQAGLEGITLPADYASLAAKTATPEQIAAARAASTPGDLLAAGAKSVGADPMAFAKTNFKPLAAAAAPIMADMMVPTTTQMAPIQSPGRIREKRWDGRQFVDVANTDASVFNTSGRSFSDPYRGYNNGGIVALAGGGNYTTLTKDSSADDIASAYKQFTTASGGDTAANQKAAVDYLTNLGIGQDKIGQAYGTYQASPTYTAYTPEQMGSFLSNPVNKDINLDKAIIDTNANPADVNRYIASLSSPFVGSTWDKGGSGTLGIYNDMVNKFISPDEYYAAVTANDPKYAGWTKDMINKGYSLTGGALDLSKQIERDKVVADPVFGYDKQWVKFMDDNKYDANDMAQALGLSIKDVTDRYNRVKAAEKVITKTGGTGTGTSTGTGVTTTTPITYSTDGTGPGGSLETVLGLPPGVSGAGITTVNPNGTITTRPNIPGIPVGGFTGMTSLRDAYTKGGGSLGYTSPTFDKIEDFNKTYVTDRMSGDSLAAYEYLTGKKGAKYPTKSGVGQISEDYATAVLGYPARGNLPYIYNKATGKMDVNPDYVAPGRDAAGNVTYSMSLNDIKSSLKESPLSGQALYEWAMTNNLSAQQIADATGRSLSSVYSDFRAGSKAAAKKKEDDKAAGINTLVDNSSAGGGEGGGPGGGGGGGGTGPGGVGGAGGPASTSAVGAGDVGGVDAEGGYYSRGKLNYRAKNMAMGGATGYALGGLGTLGGYSDGGRLLKGPGDGVSDSIPATIGRKQQPARLADGEFVIPARIVSELGNGSTDAGAKKLYAMMDRVQRARGKTTGKNKVAANSRADKYLPA